MPFVSIRLAGSATKEQKAGLVADVTASLVARLGKNPAAVQVVIEEVSLENYGSAGPPARGRRTCGTLAMTR